MSTRSLVLQALRDAGSAGVSGETIARELGLSRVAIAKHIAALRAAGYSIEARAGEGYRLLATPDLPLPGEVAPRLTDSFWVRVEGAEETGSTNDDARELARRGAPEGTAVVAARQTAGRGRFARTWLSPTGGAYLSAILRPPLGTLELAPLALVIAVGVARGLVSLGASPRLKWPNDVLLQRGKVAGILLEMSGQADRVDWVVVGVGVNVQPLGEPPGQSAAAVSDAVPDARAADVAGAVMDGIASAYQQWLAEGFSALRKEFESMHALSGRAVIVRDLQGGIVAAGTVQRIDEIGRLILLTEAGSVPVASGDVTLRDS
ncbi:MAG TPA: biotin--[acetyl-CoA-carboxylase] ligase [Coriobacteriia bacterium]|nr:biotin--[acetyl-CoA-carboxylase] ligase [Coriobacteriia bacterium]